MRKNNLLPLLRDDTMVLSRAKCPMKFENRRRSSVFQILLGIILIAFYMLKTPIYGENINPFYYPKGQPQNWQYNSGPQYPVLPCEPVPQAPVLPYYPAPQPQVLPYNPSPQPQVMPYNPSPQPQVMPYYSDPQPQILPYYSDPQPQVKPYNPPVNVYTVDLTTLNPYYTSNKYFEVVSGIKDTLGNKYKTGIRSFADHIGGRWSGGETYWVWDIGGKYNKLTATGIIRNEDKGASLNLNGLVRIYGDGRLLYEKNNITSNTKPYYINVNISGVKDLKLEMYGQSSELGWSGINTVLVDIMLQ